MEGRINDIEMYELLNGEHRDPYHILGMHQIEWEDKVQLMVNVFIPQAKRIIVNDPDNKSAQYEMKKIHEYGFFSVSIDDRSEWFRYQLDIEDYEGHRWSTYDPYSFMPVISEVDLYLFGQGTHYKIYEKLGAHPTIVDGINGVLFAVWAPNAKRVSVVGDFNAWDGRRHAMRTLGSSGIWEIFIPGLQENDKYKFEIKSRDNHILLKTDPYGHYAEVRPNTASVIYNIEKYEWNDSVWIDQREKSDFLNKPISIYEVHLGSWKRKVTAEFLTYRELAHELVDYVKEMGYTHIELMPVAEHPFDGSWGYQVTGYYAPTSRFGTPDDFMYFIDYCHQHNIGVIMDWVPAHFPKDAHGLAKFDGTALYEHADPRQGEHPDWGTLIFNYGRCEIKNFLIANALYWIEKYHIDGLRVDAVASMLYLDYGKNEGEWVPNKYGGRENIEAVEFLKHLNSIAYKKFPGILMIAEESTAWANVSRPTSIGGLGFALKWNMGWMNDFLRYIEKDPIHRKYHHNDLTFSMVYAYTENFVLVLSHDEVVHGKGAMINKMPGDYWQKFANLRVAYGLMYAHPGKKLLFMGGEFGQFDEWNEQKSLDWHLLDFDKHRELQEYTKELNRLYQKERALWEDDFTSKGFEWINCGDASASLVTFIRKAKESEDMVVIACNFTPTTHMEYRMGVPYDCVYEEIFNSDKTEYGGSNVLNSSTMKAEKIQWDGRPFSIKLKLPPLGITMLKPKF